MRTWVRIHKRLDGSKSNEHSSAAKRSVGQTFSFLVRFYCMLFTSLDWERSGKQQGFLQIPYSHNLGGWANVMIPVTTVANGQGPTVLVLGGNHGDEYQGQIAAMKLAREAL